MFSVPFRGIAFLTQGRGQRTVKSHRIELILELYECHDTTRQGDIETSAWVSGAGRRDVKDVIIQPSSWSIILMFMGLEEKLS